MTTTQSRNRWIICGVASFILNALPVMIYVVKAFIEGQATYQKVGISMTILVTAILTAVSLISKVALRCRLWYLMIGIYLAVDTFIAALIILARGAFRIRIWSTEIQLRDTFVSVILIISP